jgi:hypothetical protein
MSIGDVWRQVFDQVIDVQPVRYPILVLATGLLAAALVVWRPSWRVLRGLETIVHEGGHAAAAALTGRRLHGVRLHSDTSGLTVSRGRPTGPGRVLTVIAGYPASAVLGLGGVALLRAEHAAALLWARVVLLVAMLVIIRNLYGAGDQLIASPWRRRLRSRPAGPAHRGARRAVDRAVGSADAGSGRVRSVLAVALAGTAHCLIP